MSSRIFNRCHPAAIRRRGRCYLRSVWHNRSRLSSDLVGESLGKHHRTRVSHGIRAGTARSRAGDFLVNGFRFSVSRVSIGIIRYVRHILTALFVQSFHIFGHIPQYLGDGYSLRVERHVPR